MTVMGIGIGIIGIGKKWEWEWLYGNGREWEQKQSFPHTSIRVPYRDAIRSCNPSYN